MMTFEDRERAFEAKYAHDEHLRFRVAARRDKLFVRWAAEQLHLSEQRWNDLTTAVLAIADGPGHDQRVLDHMSHAFRDNGQAATSETLAPALQRCADQARRELIEQPV